MKQKIVVSLLVICVIDYDCSSAKKNTEEKHSKSALNWQDSTIIVDGSSNEWDKSEMEYDRKSNIAYKFTNDADNIYILLITYDNRTQMKILNGGISFYIDSDGKKKENAVIDYPLETKNRFSYFQQEPDIASEYILRGFKMSNRNSTIAESNRKGIQVKIGVDSMNKMVYEAAIPLVSVYGGKHAANTSRRFSLGFKINGLTQADINKVMFEMSDVNPQTKMSDTETNNAQILSQTVKIWKNIILASK